MSEPAVLIEGRPAWLWIDDVADQLGAQGVRILTRTQAFGYFAVRSTRGLPLSLPTTTGVPRPMPGGERHRAA